MSITLIVKHLKLLDQNLPLHARECIVRAMENCTIVGDISNYRDALTHIFQINLETNSIRSAIHIVFDELDSDRNKYDDFWRTVK